MVKGRLDSRVLTGFLVTVTLISAFSLSSVSAVDTVNSNVHLAVPVSCSISGNLDTPHTKNVNPGTYNTDIGTTTFEVLCNDSATYSIYAIGYSNEEYGNTKLLATIGGVLSPSNDIVTGLNTSSGVSNWSMKLQGVAGHYPPTIVNNYDNYNVVPTNYTKVATLTSTTGSTIGSQVQSTYAVFAATDQPAGTYNGKVKYTLVHPDDADAPISRPAILDTGQVVNTKLKSLAATVVNGTETTIAPEFDPEGDYDWDNAYDQYIKSIVVHLETPAPSGFTPTASNTISSSTSQKPVYIVFDNANDAGIMHFYTEGEQIVLSSDSSFMFYMLYNLTTISGISDWDTSNVTDMGYMFDFAGQDATTFTLDFSSWDTSNVTNMSHMFYVAGESATTWSIGDLSSWDTFNVTDMSYMFNSAGESATTWSIGDLSSWDTSSVTDMSGIFESAGRSATIWSIGGLSSWDTSSVTNMSYMFSSAGYSATTFSLDLSSWDTSSVTNMNSMFHFAGYSATTFTLNLSSWDTSSVTSVTGMFTSAGRSATTWSIGGLSSWDTSSVTNMSYMFSSVGYSATTFSLDLSSWDTSSVTNMVGMFSSAGYSAATFSLDLSSWDTSSVTNMSRMFDSAGFSATTFSINLSSWNTYNATNMGNMFSSAGYRATTWSVTIPKTNNGTASGPIANTTSRLYGKTTSTRATPPTGKSFTLAQP